MTEMSDSRTPFEKRPKFSWRELGFLASLIGTAAAAWAIQRADIAELQHKHEELVRRQDKIEEAVAAIPAMQHDISWIRSSMEQRGDRAR